MFEYLMPLLVMPTFENTLLDRTYKTMVDRQISYGKQLDVPWGISESGYNLVDANMEIKRVSTMSLKNLVRIKNIYVVNE